MGFPVVMVLPPNAGIAGGLQLVPDALYHVLGRGSNPGRTARRSAGSGSEVESTTASQLTLESPRTPGPILAPLAGGGTA